MVVTTNKLYVGNRVMVKNKPTITTTLDRSRIYTVSSVSESKRGTMIGLMGVGFNQDGQPYFDADIFDLVVSIPKCAILMETPNHKEVRAQNVNTSDASTQYHVLNTLRTDVMACPDVVLSKEERISLLREQDYRNRKANAHTTDKNAVAEDVVNHPNHYTRGKIECIDAVASAVEGLPAEFACLTWQVIKYMWRWYFKGKPLEDLEKARFYLNRLIEKVKETV